MSDQSKLTRRDFIKDAAIGAAAVAGAGVLGATPALAQGTAQPWLPAKWDKEYDVIVVGSGGAGYTAACFAKKAGAGSVVVLEKLPEIGGNSRTSGGNVGTYNDGVDELEKKMQKENPEWEVGDSAELYYKEKLRLGNYRADPAVAHAFAYDSKAMYVWITGLGMQETLIRSYAEFTDFEAPENLAGMNLQGFWNCQFDKKGWYIGPFTKGRHHRDGSYTDAKGEKYSSGEGVIFAIADEGDRLGVELICQMQVTEIFRQNRLDGDVVGVRVKDLANNKELAFRAKKGVVLAAGGIHNNLEMVKRYDPRQSIERLSSGARAAKRKDGGKPGRKASDGQGRGTTGEVLVAALDIGADTNILGEMQISWDSMTALNGVAPTSSRGKYIDVNNEGNRVWMEGTNKQYTYSKLTYVAENRDKFQTTKGGDGSWWAVTDSGIAQTPAETAVVNAAVSTGTLKADTLEELAKLMGVPAANLVATVKRYNELVDKGEDVDFGQLKAYLKYKMLKPPYYAWNKCYIRHTDMGGLRVNDNFQVIDRRGQAIPRLYAAGEQEGSTHGLERDGGCGWTQCLVGGSRAGKHVAALKSVV